MTLSCYSMGDTVIDLEGQKITLGPEYSSGQFGFNDFLDLAKEQLKAANIYGMLDKQLKLTEFFYNLKRGDTKELIVVIITLCIGIYVGVSLLTALTAAPAKPRVVQKKEEEVPDPPRDFTIEQLREFDGSNEKPIYIALRGEVYDVSVASDFYGEGSGYHCFAGREASRAMARLSFEEADLANPNVDDLGPFDRSTLDDWIQKFKYYKCYPVVGRVSYPPQPRNFTREELAAFNGTQEQLDPKRVDVPILVGINGKVIDVSYGGKAMYGAGGPYNIFAGRDASRALAKMSFKPEDLNSSDLSDLTPEQQKTLAEWETKFIVTRKYPVVGNLVK